MIIQFVNGLSEGRPLGGIFFYERQPEPYLGIVEQVNGRQERKNFVTYLDALRWLAAGTDSEYLLRHIDEPLESTSETENILTFLDQLPDYSTEKYSLTLSADEKKLFLLSDSGQIMIIDRLTGMPTAEKQFPAFDAASIVPATQKVIISRHREIEVWDLTTLEREKRFPIPFAAKAVDLWTDEETVILQYRLEHTIATEGQTTYLQLYSLQEGLSKGQMREWPASIFASVQNTVFTPEKDWVTYSQIYEAPYGYDRIRLYVRPVKFEKFTTKMDTAKIKLSRFAPPNREEKTSGGCLWGVWLILRLTLANILRNIVTGLFRRTSSPPDYLERYQDSWIYASLFAPDGKTLFLSITNHDNKYANQRKGRPIGHHIHLWERSWRGKFKSAAWLSGHATPIGWLFNWAEGKQLISISVDGNVKFWDVQSRKEIDSFLLPINSLSLVVLQKNGELLAAGSEYGKVVVWNLPKGITVHNLHGHNSPVRHLLFTESDGNLITASQRGKILEWTLSHTTPLPRILGREILEPPPPNFSELYKPEN